MLHLFGSTGLQFSGILAPFFGLATRPPMDRPSEYPQFTSQNEGRAYVAQSESPGFSPLMSPAQYDNAPQNDYDDDKVPYDTASVTSQIYTHPVHRTQLGTASFIRRGDSARTQKYWPVERASSPYATRGRPHTAHLNMTYGRPTSLWLSGSALPPRLARAHMRALHDIMSRSAHPSATHGAAAVRTRIRTRPHTAQPYAPQTTVSTPPRGAYSHAADANAVDMSSRGASNAAASTDAHPHMDGWVGEEPVGVGGFSSVEGGLALEEAAFASLHQRFGVSTAEHMDEPQSAYRFAYGYEEDAYGPLGEAGMTTGSSVARRNDTHGTHAQRASAGQSAGSHQRLPRPMSGAQLTRQRDVALANRSLAERLARAYTGADPRHRSALGLPPPRPATATATAATVLSVSGPGLTTQPLARSRSPPVGRPSSPSSPASIHRRAAAARRRAQARAVDAANLRMAARLARVRPDPLLCAPHTTMRDDVVSDDHAHSHPISVSVPHRPSRRRVPAPVADAADSLARAVRARAASARARCQQADAEMARVGARACARLSLLCGGDMLLLAAAAEGTARGSADNATDGTVAGGHDLVRGNGTGKGMGTDVSRGAGSDCDAHAHAHARPATAHASGGYRGTGGYASAPAPIPARVRPATAALHTRARTRARADTRADMGVTAYARPDVAADATVRGWAVNARAPTTITTDAFAYIDTTATTGTADVPLRPVPAVFARLHTAHTQATRAAVEAGERMAARRAAAGVEVGRLVRREEREEESRREQRERARERQERIGRERTRTVARNAMAARSTERRAAHLSARGSGGSGDVGGGGVVEAGAMADAGNNAYAHTLTSAHVANTTVPIAAAAAHLAPTAPPTSPLRVQPRPRPHLPLPPPPSSPSLSSLASSHTFAPSPADAPALTPSTPCPSLRRSPHSRARPRASYIPPAMPYSSFPTHPPPPASSATHSHVHLHTVTATTTPTHALPYVPPNTRGGTPPPRPALAPLPCPSTHIPVLMLPRPAIHDTDVLIPSNLAAAMAVSQNDAVANNNVDSHNANVSGAVATSPPPSAAMHMSEGARVGVHAEEEPAEPDVVAQAEAKMEVASNGAVYGVMYGVSAEHGVTWIRDQHPHTHTHAQAQAQVPATVTSETHTQPRPSLQQLQQQRQQQRPPPCAPPPSPPHPPAHPPSPAHPPPAPQRFSPRPPRAAHTHSHSTISLTPSLASTASSSAASSSASLMHMVIRVSPPVVPAHPLMPVPEIPHAQPHMHTDAHAAQTHPAVPALPLHTLNNGSGSSDAVSTYAGYAGDSVGHGVGTPNGSGHGIGVAAGTNYTDDDSVAVEQSAPAVQVDAAAHRVAQAYALKVGPRGDPNTCLNTGIAIETEAAHDGADVEVEVDEEEEAASTRVYAPMAVYLSPALSEDQPYHPSGGSGDANVDYNAGRNDGDGGEADGGGVGVGVGDGDDWVGVGELDGLGDGGSDGGSAWGDDVIIVRGAGSGGWGGATWREYEERHEMQEKGERGEGEEAGGGERAERAWEGDEWAREDGEEEGMGGQYEVDGGYEGQYGYGYAYDYGYRYGEGSSAAQSEWEADVEVEAGAGMATGVGARAKEEVEEGSWYVGEGEEDAYLGVGVGTAVGLEGDDAGAWTEAGVGATPATDAYAAGESVHATEDCREVTSEQGRGVTEGQHQYQYQYEHEYGCGDDATYGYAAVAGAPT